MQSKKIAAGAVFPKIQVTDLSGSQVDIANNPFVRPELEALVSGLSWIRNPENNYPIRGTYK